jgi:hypothetical protein
MEMKRAFLALRLRDLVSIASAAENFRSLCDSLRNPPEFSSQGSPIAAPHVGHGTAMSCFGVSSLFFIKSSSLRCGQCGGPQTFLTDSRSADGIERRRSSGPPTTKIAVRIPFDRLNTVLGVQSCGSKHRNTPIFGGLHSCPNVLVNAGIIHG